MARDGKTAKHSRTNAAALVVGAVDGRGAKITSSAGGFVGDDGSGTVVAVGTNVVGLFTALLGLKDGSVVVRLGSIDGSAEPDGFVDNAVVGITLGASDGWMDEMFVLVADSSIAGVSNFREQCGIEGNGL